MFSFDAIEPHVIPPSSMGQLKIRITIDLSTGYRYEGLQTDVNRYPEDSRGSSVNKYSYQGYRLKNNEDYLIIFTRYVYIDNNQIALNKLIANCVGRSNKFLSLISTTNLRIWRGKSETYVYQGPIAPTTHELYVVNCDSEIMQYPNSTLSIGYHTRVGQPWYINTKFVRDKDLLWAELFIPTNPTKGYILAECVERLSEN